MEKGRRNGNHLKLVEEPIADVIYMTDIVKDSMAKRREMLSGDQKEYFHTQAAHSELVIEDLKVRLEEEIAKRSYYMTMLGMLPDLGYDE